MNYRIITLDFESFYAQDYSLNFMPMQEYILDPRFEVIGVAVSIDGAYPRWVPGQGAAHLYLQSLNLEEPGTIVVAHNAMFDGGILEFQLGIRPWKYFCTMMGARPNLVPITSNGRMSLAALAEHVPEVGDKGGFITHAKGKRFHDFTSSQLSEYGDYCIRDTAICEALYRKITANMPSGEQDLLDLTIKKFTRPQVKLDSSVLAQELQRIRTDKARLLERVGMSDAKELNSNPKFAQALVGAGLPEAQVPRKLSPATNKETFAFAKTDAEFRALKDHPNETVQALVAARMGHKSTLAETRTERFLTLSQFDRFAVPLLYWGARPGRFSGYDKLNCQNLPRKGALRRAIKAPKGYKIVPGDLSQIEARVVALLAGEQKLLNQFAAGVDVYSHFAADHIFNTSLSSIGDLERFFGKTSILGLGYGMGPAKFETTILNAENYLPPEMFRKVKTMLTKKFVNAIVYGYRDHFNKISELWNTAGTVWINVLLGGEPGKVRRATQSEQPLFFGKGFIGLPNGMSLRYTDLRYESMDGSSPAELIYGRGKNKYRLYGAKLVENVVQALSRIIVTDAELFLAARGYRAVLSVHDELVYSIPEGKAEQFAEVLSRVLTRPVSWAPNLPLACETGVGDNYGDAKG